MTTPRRVRALGLVVAPLLLVMAAPAVAASGDVSGGEDCTELVTHAPSGSQGDPTTVAITSQVLVADVDGWEAVTWEADEGVEVDAVLVDTGDGTEVLDGARTGDVHGAQALTFCGEVFATTPAGADTSTDASLAAGPAVGATDPLLGASVGGMLAGLVLLASLASRRGRDLETLA